MMNCANDTDEEHCKNKTSSIDSTATNSTPSFHKWKFNWIMIILIILGHGGAVIGIYLGVTHAKIATLIFYFITIQFGATGIICGAHRLWTHRTYKAHIVLRIFLMLCQTFALQQSIYDWSLWHRVHHKYSDTDADPHNAKRGFFFSHIGWICVYPHPEYVAKSKTIDTSDLKNDPVVRFQHKYYAPLVILISYLIPTLVPWYFWNETFRNAFFVNIFRHILSIHQTSLVNSAAHIFGSKPYDERIEPTEHKFTTYVTMGEAYHNYHHAFPWDYSASEFAWDVNYNPMTAFIDLCAKLNLAWDRKKVDRKLVEDRIRKHGNIDQLDIILRKPKSLLLDTIIGIISLFWALWVILALKYLLSLSWYSTTPLMTSVFD